GRVHALWTLDALGGLDESMILRALNDSEPGVRENALRLAEPRLGRSSALWEAVVKRADLEPDARVQFQVLATLGFIDSDPSVAAQSRVLPSHIDDVWMRRAG